MGKILQVIGAATVVAGIFAAGRRFERWRLSPPTLGDKK